MDFEKYTERSRGFIQSAQTLALREGHQKFSPEHVLKVLLDDDEGLASGLIKAAGGDSRLALRDTEAALAKMPKVSGAGRSKVRLHAEFEGEDGPDSPVSQEHGILGTTGEVEE